MECELSVQQIAKKMEIDTNNARVYVNRLIKEGKIREISKSPKVYSASIEILAKPAEIPITMSIGLFLKLNRYASEKKERFSAVVCRLIEELLDREEQEDKKDLLAIENQQ